MSGGCPELIRWALVTTPDCWAWRKIRVSRTRGDRAAVGEQVAQHLARADDWAAGRRPRRSSRCAPGGTALTSLLASSRSSIEASSTTTRSASSGRSRSYAASPPGLSSSSRCTVEASAPVSSASRLAARPVGAASTTLAFLARASSTIERTVKDLPQPGPPVSTATFSVSASRTACLLLGGELGPRTPREPGQRLVPVHVPEGGHPVLVGAQQAQQLGGEGEFGAVEGHQVDGGDGLRRRPGPAPSPVRRPPVLGGASSARHSMTRPVSTWSSFTASRDQPLLGEEAVALVGGLRQGVLQARLDPLRAVVRDADGLGDLVGGEEADAPDVGGQPVGLVLHDGDRGVAVLLVDAHRDGGGDPDALEEDHDLLDGLLLLPGGGDHLGPLGAEAGDLDRAASGSSSMMSRVSRPKCSTIRSAITGPMPLIRPEPR